MYIDGYSGVIYWPFNLIPQELFTPPLLKCRKVMRPALRNLYPYTVSVNKPHASGDSRGVLDLSAAYKPKKLLNLEEMPQTLLHPPQNCHSRGGSSVILEEIL